MNWQEILKDKIFDDRKKLAEEIQRWKDFNDTVVFTNGCFDILHRGHIDYLSKAAEQGDRFVIGVNTDRSVSTLKGPRRPIIDEDSRALKLAALAFVDAVILFDEDTPLELITELKPNVLIKGGDYTEETVVGADFVKSNGGKVMLIPFLEGYSTSSIIEKIKGE
ncbi:D-glycero-beta-D-manno-heptose 1-phosphate adenylyltransferase [bacterium]|nr:D-glycero-beta-D-manno-heptose 1-phosphate adenylyltransferase [bacterium]